MVTILICWAVSSIIGGLWGLLLRQTGAAASEKEEGGGVPEYDPLPVLREAFRRAAPNSRGRGSLDYLNLSTAIQKIEAGEDVPTGVCVYLLEKIGAGDLAEKLKTGEGV